ncbi:Cro/Cl family transcriptional regulator [Paracidovorax avenae]|uniref:XRE family transcriptional regulator n=1 Tax=Paracidovorax avenae TaxID=80867 RepID=UPI000D20AFD1|nr:XRE family transcriptional regulator [Paracidovorax avenae]AVS64774.1 Cro/Cl family transcriptional regulator [Paracidovorax avenae]
MSNILHSQTTDGNVLAFVSENLRRLRAEAGVSQLALAEAAGLSRRMISSLEAGDTNISLASLDRLAAALGVGFVALVSDPSARSQRVDALAWKGKSKDSRGVLLGYVPATQEAQLWSWALAPGETYHGQADPAGWHEMVFVVAGTLTLRFEHEMVMVAAGDYCIYSSAQDYVCENAGTEILRFVKNVVC